MCKLTRATSVNVTSVNETLALIEWVFYLLAKLENHLRSKQSKHVSSCYKLDNALLWLLIYRNFSWMNTFSDHKKIDNALYGLDEINTKSKQANSLAGVRQESKGTCCSVWVMRCLIYQGPPWNIMLQNTIYLIQNDTDSAIRDSSRSPNQERCHFALKDTRWAGAYWCVLQKRADEGFTRPSTALCSGSMTMKEWFWVIEQYITLKTSFIFQF